MYIRTVLVDAVMALLFQAERLNNAYDEADREQLAGMHLLSRVNGASMRKILAK